MIRLIVTDIDGTLLHDHATSVDFQYFELIKKMKNKGILFCVASGRQYQNLRTLFEPVKDDILYIVQNGTEIMYHDKSFFSMPMSIETSRQLVRDARAISGAGSMYCTGDVAYFEEKDREIYCLMKNEYHFSCEIVEDLLELNMPCQKFSLYLSKYVNKDIAECFTAKWKKTHEAAFGGTHFISVTRKGVNKGTALKRMQDILKISKAETVAFGDNHNDLEMMSEAGESYAVANARIEVKNMATDLIPSNNEDGVLEQIKKIIGNNIG